MTTPNNDLRARLRQLLTIPERDRTDEEWDAIVAIEIELGPGKVVAQPKQGNQPPGGGPRHQNKPKGQWKPKPKPNKG